MGQFYEGNQNTKIDLGDEWKRQIMNKEDR
jgi:hypothetical protein